MPAQSITKHPVYPHVLTFTEHDHRYVDNLRIRYTSVTSRVKEFTLPFAENPIADAIARRDGTTREAVIAGWRAKSKEACEYGTRVHEYAEFLFSGGSRGVRHDPRTSTEARAFEAVSGQFSALVGSGRFRVAGIESVVFCPLRRVAGTIDLILREVATGQLVLVDWKTNAQIKRRGHNDQTMTDGLAHLQDCAYSHYTLQLSLYWQVLLSACWVPKNVVPKSRIIHINHEGESEVIKMDFLDKESAYLLNYEILQGMEAAQ